MIQQFHFWAYTQKNGEQGPKEIFAHHVHSQEVKATRVH